MSACTRRCGGCYRSVREGAFHPHMRQRIPDDITHVYRHQEEAIRAIRAGPMTRVSTGTGSGKTQRLLYPIVSTAFHCDDMVVSRATPACSAARTAAHCSC